MAEVSMELVKTLRDRTGAGMMDCKKALEEAKGSIETAIEVLRKKGLKDLSKRSGRTSAEGVVGVYAHPGDQIVSICELNCETDFVARNDDFKRTAREIAMHVAALKPQYLSPEEIPAAVIEKEKEICLSQLNDAQKSKADKILPGKLEKFYEEVCLLNQKFVKDDTGTKTVKVVIEELGVKTGEKVVLRRFQRFEVGEGIEKKTTDYAAEVSAIVQSV